MRRPRSAESANDGYVLRHPSDTSTLRPKTKESNCSLILRTGLWLAQTHPEVRMPESWQMSTCADFIAAVDQLHTRDWSLNSAIAR